jgi:hypothetical protein
MTGALRDLGPNADKTICRELSKYFEADGGWVPPRVTVDRHFLPIEMELSAARADHYEGYIHERGSGALNDPNYSGVFNVLSETDKKWTDYRALFYEQTRSDLKTDAKVQAGVLGGGTAPLDRFKPFESAFLTCRIRHLGKQELEKKFYDAALGQTDAARLQGFVAYWRKFVVSELSLYAADDATAEGLILPKLRELDKQLLDRIEASLNGMPADFSIVKPITPPPPPPPPPPPQPKKDKPQIPDPGPKLDKFKDAYDEYK